MSPSIDALQGLRVLELGQLIAGPFAGKTLADFGADVLKIEPVEAGDPLRKWRLLREGTSVWWEAMSRNKRSVTGHRNFKPPLHSPKRPETGPRSV